MTDNNFDKEVAELVIRPKLQTCVSNNPDIKNKAELRAMFMEQEGFPISAAKFDEYLKTLDIEFVKTVTIKGLSPASSPRPVAGATEPEEEIVFDNEDPNLVNEVIDRRSGHNRNDMFGLA